MRKIGWKAAVVTLILANLLWTAVALVLIALNARTLARHSCATHPQVVAHRGASHEAPENSLAAIVRAIEMGADMVEFDVRVTKDGVPILMHDDTVDRTTNGSGKVADCSSGYIEGLLIDRPNAKRFPDQGVPTLREALREVKDQATAIVELKEGTAVSAVVEVICEEEMADQVAVISFHDRLLADVEQSGENIRTGLLIRRQPLRGGKAFAKAALGRANACGADFLDVNTLDASPTVVDAIHTAGMQVWVYTVNSEEAMRRSILDGVDAITTNKPAALGEVLDETGTSAHDVR